MSQLADRQFDLDGYVFGHRSAAGVVVTDIEWGSPEPRTNDKERPRADGTRFGREWRSGRTITLEVCTLHTEEGGALDEIERFSAAWDAISVRAAPGSMSVLRYHINGRTRRVYGRARRIEPNAVEYRAGKILLTCTFDTEGPYYYRDTPEETSVGLVPPITGGFSFPMVFPAHTTGMGERRVGITNPGHAEAPIILYINGPIDQPIVEVLGRWQWQLLDTLLPDHQVVIDTRPWAMSARRNGVVNVAGRISTTSPRMREMWLPPGSHDIVLRGHDTTATASLSVQAWPAYASF